MAYVITDLNDFEIQISDGFKDIVIWKQNIRFGVIDGDTLPLYWHNKALLNSRYELLIDWNDVTTPVVASAAALQTAIEGMITSGWGGSGTVSSVNDDGGGVVTVDNTNPAAPIVGFAGVNVDGVTITGDGTVGNPLVAATGLADGDYGDVVISGTGTQITNKVRANRLFNYWNLK